MPPKSRSAAFGIPRKAGFFMELNITSKDGKIIAEVQGRIDTTNSEGFQQAMLSETAKTDDLVLDCAKLIYISSAGLRALLSTHKVMAGKSGKFTLTNVSEDVMEIFDITGFSDILTII